MHTPLKYHREDPDKNKITLEQVYDTKVETKNQKNFLNLLTNFNNYLDIRKKFNPSNTAGFFQGSFEEIDIELAIFTNAKCDFTPSNQAELNPLLKTNDEGRAFQIEPSVEMIEILSKDTKTSEILQNEGKDDNEQNCKSIVEDFFKSYKIYYNQVNEEEVAEITMKEIGTEDPVLYLMYHDSMQQYWKDKNEVKFLTKECDFLEKAKQKVIERPKLTNLTEIGFKSSQRFDLDFSAESFQELGFDTILADKRIINVSSTVPILSYAKICQHLKLKFKLSLAIVDFDLDGVDSGEILSMFLKSNEFKCLIVRSSKQVAELKQSQLGTKLAECGKYIILISEAALMSGLPQVQDLRINFADLTTNCQSFLMDSIANSNKKGQLAGEETKALQPLEVNTLLPFNNKIISFQGRLIKFVDLIRASDKNGSNDPDRLITRAIWLHLLGNNFCEIVPLERKQVPYYIGRRFKRLRKVKNFQNQEKIVIVQNDCITVMSESELEPLRESESKYLKFTDFMALNSENFEKTQKDVVIISETKEHFDEICSRHPLRNVHWFKQHEDHFLWQCSLNSVAKLRDALQYDDEEFPLENFESFPEPVMIIADEPGMGKSTLMTQLEQQKEISSLSMVIRINLFDYTSIFQSMKNKNVEFEEVKSFLLNVLQMATPNSNSEKRVFEQVLFESFLNHKNLVLLVDGFHEIAPNYVKPVLNFLNTAKEHVKKLIVTTHDNSAKSKLESSLNVFAHSFVPFTENDIRNFLEMFWKTNLTDAELNQARFEEFVTAMLEEYTQADFNGKSFISTPLHIEMIATCLQSLLEDYIKTGSSDILKKLRKEFNLCSLYENFINIKFNNIYLEKNLKIHPSGVICTKYKIHQFEESHTRLALYAICDENIVKKLLSKEEFYKIKTDIEKIATGKEKRGFVSRIVDGKPHFTHLTFAEFFVAKAVWKWLKHYSSDQQDVAKVFLENLIRNDERHICQLIHDIALSDSTQAENATDLVDLVLGKLKSSFLKRQSWTNGRNSSDYLLSVVEHCLINPPDAMLNATFNLLTDDEKFKLLNSSAKMGYSKLVRILATQLGTDFLKKAFSERGEWEFSPLYLAASNHHYEIVKSLVRDFHFDVTWLDECGDSFCSYLLQHEQYGSILNLIKIGLYELGKPYFNNKWLPLYDALSLGKIPQNVIELLLEVTDVDFFNTNYVSKFNFYLLRYDLSLTKKFLDRGFFLRQSIINLRGDQIMPVNLFKCSFNGDYKCDAFNRVWIDRMRFLCENGVGFDTKLPTRLTEIHCILKLFKNASLDRTDWKNKLLKGLITSEKCNRIFLRIDLYKIRLDFEGKTILLNEIMNDIAQEKIRQRCKNGYESNEISSKEKILRVLNLAYLSKTTDHVKNIVSEAFIFLSGDKIEALLNVELGKEFLNPALHKEISSILSKLIHFMTDLCTKWRNIMAAIENDDLDGIRVELESLDSKLRKTLINSWDDEYGSPLHFAAYRRNYQITKYLLENGANPNSRTDFNCTPKKMPFDENVNKIIKRGAVTPMFIAAAKGDLPIVKLLHEKGGCINAKTYSNGYTPLDVAEAAGHSDVIEYLIGNGAERRD
ncbi:uncharacterized protein LOC119765250 isoform X2 [Culex quinquefasciatus]|uniref:uncharacterized protein LOC119765250 isoform X1 n=1 Tax=Culex quinquefasciatus TaxID=7176 RepID=UPI0018E37DA9|nr:uncharacterized protein LOC119765250 isoform X1 [Culex quinquefasciatus]XP_038104659.1 uncharacterized protein LOC119765250 isoform X2 [Culex quinquefasciatus]